MPKEDKNERRRVSNDRERTKPPYKKKKQNKILKKLYFN